MIYNGTIVNGGVLYLIKNKEKIIQEQTAKITQQVKEYVEEMDALSDTSEFTIDNIEKQWGELEHLTRQIYKEINNEIVRQFNEKEIIRSKKGNMQRKE